MATRTTKRIDGRNLMLFTAAGGKDTTSLAAIACAESCSVDITTNFTELVDKDTSVYNEVEIDTITWECKSSNMMSRYDDFKALVAKQLAGDDVWIRFGEVSNPTDDAVEQAEGGKWSLKTGAELYGKCKIQSISLTAEAKGKAKFNVTFKGSGKIYLAGVSEYEGV